MGSNANYARPSPFRAGPRHFDQGAGAGGEALPAEPDQRERDGVRDGLDEQDGARGGGGAEQARDDDAAEEEQAQRQGLLGVRGEQTPDQAGGEEAVVEALVGRQRRRLLGLLD